MKEKEIDEPKKVAMTHQNTSDQKKTVKTIQHAAKLNTKQEEKKTQYRENKFFENTARERAKPAEETVGSVACRIETRHTSVELGIKTAKLQNEEIIGKNLEIGKTKAKILNKKEKRDEEKISMDTEKSLKFL